MRKHGRTYDRRKPRRDDVRREVLGGTRPEVEERVERRGRLVLRNYYGGP